jgi:hypothetical protein
VPASERVDQRATGLLVHARLLVQRTSKVTAALALRLNVTRADRRLVTVPTTLSERRTGAGVTGGPGVAIGGVTTGGAGAGGSVGTGVGEGLGEDGLGVAVGLGVGVGVGEADSAVSAAAAFNRPPVNADPLRTPRTSTDVSRADFSSAVVAPGSSAASKAAAPATCGLAIDVPFA